MSSSSESSSGSPPTKRKTLPNKTKEKETRSKSSKVNSKSIAKVKTDLTSQSSSIKLVKQIEADRISTAESVLQFDYKKKRIRILSKVQSVPETCGGIVYWMSRDARVQDNWALLYAQKLAIKNRVPLHICFCFVPKFLDAPLRHFKFLLGGLREVVTECRSLDIQFHMLEGEASKRIPKLVKDLNIGGVICDVWPMRLPKQWLTDLLLKLPESVAVCQVDAQNIVPLWETSDKQEYAARTIRNKVNKQLDVYLQHFPPLIHHPYSAPKHAIASPIDWNRLLDSIDADTSVDEVDWAKPGYKAGINELHEFCQHRLRHFNAKRNDPVANALSNLSPWFRFGHISVQRCILTVREYRSKYPESVAAFCEEAIVRRELSDNFCYYNDNYDSIDGLSDWAKSTLLAHKKDTREWVYSRADLEKGLTHDDLWNAAQNQLVREGKMHGFLRMYWAKKILEWTAGPEVALADSIYLNDKYALDGLSPNGYVGCMWSIGGIHDMGWKERPIFGKIRYMNYKGCQRKFDVKAFVARYGGKVYTYTPKK